MFIYEEKIIRNYKMPTLEMVGWEGVWGTICGALFLTFTSYFPSNFHFI
jgi:hypothetical protein